MDIISDTNSVQDASNNYNTLIYSKKGFQKNKMGKRVEKLVKYKVYGSNICGKIRDAVNGQYYNDLVGSANEKKYYKVISCIGERQITLFYSSEREYNAHRAANV